MVFRGQAVQIVVSDTSPIRALDHLGLLQLLPALFTRILLPPAVIAELAREKGVLRPIKVADFPYFETAIPVELVELELLLDALDPGEAEAILVATEIGADAVLIDEEDGRHVAQSRGLRTIGTIGVLLEAKSLGHIAAVRPLLDALRKELKFFISRPLYEQALRLAGESG